MNSLLRTFSPLVVALAAALLLPASSSAQDAPASPLSVAVLNFTDAANDLDGVGASVSALLQVQLTIHSDAMLVERAELNEVLAEQELTLSDAVTPTQAAKVAQLTGAEVLISGRVFAVQDRIHVVAKVISASTSRVFGASAAYDKGKPLDHAVEKLGQDVAKILKEKSADLRGGPSVEEKINAEVAARLKDKPAKKIHVHIPETIIQATVPDPAAQTEIRRTLEAAGWKSVDSAQDADIVIRGEAFAEAALRRGNLWFTRARLEFTVTDATGKILKTDRVVCGNVDLSQAVGAKGALQKAGLLAAPVIANAWIESSKKAEQ
jgi:TolB-like protein